MFDLDDTLYQEIDYLYSAYKKIAIELQPFTKEDIYEQMIELYKAKENVFQWVVSTYAGNNPNINLNFLLELYRQHEPDIRLNEETKYLLQFLKERNIPVGLITDGRSITQRNKLKALNLLNYFSEIIISEEFGSEKPDERNYLYFEKKYPEKNFYFVGDNTVKDFIVPLKLGWFTICLKSNGQNIHDQNFTNEFLPDLIIDSFKTFELIVPHESLSK